jgi:putative endonuclease
VAGTLTAWLTIEMKDHNNGNLIYVYAIKSLVRNYIYVGLTNDLDRRLLQHNNGENRSTKAYKPFIRIYEEEFGTREEARKREIYLKSGIGKEFLRNIK